ncbi:F-type H+-transporting ATPase subunit delta [Variovorax paradoxus]|uniref:F0F1 ATP synthase subunit delta n=1 Tax=Variovorax paradoxus TaxID=34073 RepID=UPI0027931215|nr:F0F1 ATP synthase subunit delta [Variovorax paradoxus]MDQ0573674.1 F-type H+-transporting ATPase subunit delta [Variovorax paradoxus]
MAELATIARPYAEALFKACPGDLEGTAGWLDQLASLAGNPQLLEFAANPKVQPEQVFELITGLSKQPLPDAGKNFLRAVIDNGRLAALPEVAIQFRALCNARSGSADAVIYSAFPIDDAALQEVGAALERRFARKLTTRVELDPSLIGGIRAVVGDEVLDTSVKARLEQMKAALTA